MKQFWRPSLLLQLFVVVTVLKTAEALDFRSHAFRTIQNAQNAITAHEKPAPQPISSFLPQPNSNPYSQLEMPSQNFEQAAFPLAQFISQFNNTLQNLNVETAPTAFPTFTFTPETQPPTTATTTQATTTEAPTTTTSLKLQTVAKANTTVFVWTTAPTTTRRAVKMSKLSVSAPKNGSGTAAQVVVPSHRLLNDILVIPSSRKLYVLVIASVHEADNKGFECGRVDVNAFVRLGAFLNALNKVNGEPVLRDAGLSLGAIIVDTCSSDLRTVADLYELLSGTNIQKNDLVAVVRDDDTHLPNVDAFIRQLHIPVINTFFTPVQKPLTTGTLPSIAAPLSAMLSLLHHTQSSCATLVYDDLHEESVRLLSEMSLSWGICIEEKIALNSEEEHAADAVVRKMLLTESRVVVVLLGADNWIKLMKAFRQEMVIAGRFLLLTLHDARWTTSRRFLDAWPHFDQLLISVDSERSVPHEQMLQLASQFPKFPFPQPWLRQFWITAFKCHIEGESANGEQFSKECSSKQNLNLTTVAPDVDIGPIVIAVNAIAHGIRATVDHICPGALIQNMHDCLNDPQESLFTSILSAPFDHELSPKRVSFNDSSSFREVSLVVKRVVFDSQLSYEDLATWDSAAGFAYTAETELIMEERDGSRVPLRSTCPKSACAAELARRAHIGAVPSLKAALSSVAVLVYAIIAVLVSFISLMCMYHQIVSAASDPCRACTTFTFAGLSFLSLTSILFMMPPNPISCAGRRSLFSVALSSVYSPILIKTLAVWRSTFSSKRTSFWSGSSLFAMSLSLVVVQIVMVFEWAAFETPFELSFTSSPQLGHAWRCAPGNSFEHRLLYSCVFIAFIIAVTLVCSFLSVSRVESRQNIFISIVSLMLAVGLFVALPLMPYQQRDELLAAVMLIFVFVVLIITYCRSAFAKHGDSSRGSLIGRSADKPDPMWIEQSIYRRNPDYQLATTLQQKDDLHKYGTEGYAPPNINSTFNSSQNGTLQRASDRVGTMPMATMRTATLTRSQPKYGNDVYEPTPAMNDKVGYGVTGTRERL